LNVPCLALLIAAGGPAAALAGEEVAVRPHSILDARQVQMEKDAGNLHRSDVGLTVTLILTGKGVEKATHWGHLKIAAAKDDRGTDIAPDPTEPQSIPPNDFVPIDRSMMFFFEEKKPKDRLVLDVRLKSPPRTSEALARMEGSLRLAEGKTRDVLTGPLADLVGKAVADPTLKSAGISVDVVKASDTPPIVLELAVKDPRKALLEVDAVDAAGKKLTSGQSFMDMDEKKQVQLMGDKGLPPGARLKLTVLIERKETTVPFKVEKVALP
jgi:hypothetical protein